MSIFPAKILLATDSSEEAELAGGTAAELANATNSELHVVYVGRIYVAVADDSESLQSHYEEPRSQYEELKQGGQRALEKQVRKLEEGGATVTQAHLRIGKREDEEIVALAEEIGAGLVVVGSRGHSGIKRLVLGSVSESVARHATCPVLVVREEGLDAFPDKILLATDGSEDSGHAAEVAAAFSANFDSELHVVHAQPEVPTPPFESWVQSRLEEEAKKTLGDEEKRIEEAGGKVAQAHLRLGSSDEEIVNLAEELGVGAVVVGGRGLDTIQAHGARERLRERPPSRSLLRSRGPRTKTGHVAAWRDGSSR